ncbi:hypothetical protein BV20DRAFT_713566 [Pilatotrama ljubarskyi]|nr:hypothetical protein BV20DRAFT_713566 [Pilatotrama ljubarskyi]
MSLPPASKTRSSAKGVPGSEAVASLCMEQCVLALPGWQELRVVEVLVAWQCLHMLDSPKRRPVRGRWTLCDVRFELSSRLEQSNCCIPSSSSRYSWKTYCHSLHATEGAYVKGRMSQTSISSAPPAPYCPSDIEATHYYHGLPSKPRLVARSSCDVWRRPTGPEAYLDSKELSPLGSHPLCGLWEKTIGPAMDEYLQEAGVRCTSMIPLRIGVVGRPSPPAVILVGVQPRSLSAEEGIQVALRCRSILVEHGISDVHVDIRESQSTLNASLYRPALSSNPAARLRKPFSTSLGIPICNATTPDVEGTGSFFFTDRAKPGILFMLTARHVLFDPRHEKNELHEFRDGAGAPHREVLLMGEVAFRARVRDIELAIDKKHITIEHLNKRLEAAAAMEDPDEAAQEQDDARSEMEKAKKAIEAFEKLLVEVNKDWGNETNRVLGHVVLSPPLSCNFGDNGYTDDWAVVEIYPTMVSKRNFVGNVIDLGSASVAELTAWMRPDRLNFTNRQSFDYPGDRLLRCRSAPSDAEMLKTHPTTQAHDADHAEPAIMVIKNGNASGLTVGRLNTVRSFVRYSFKGEPSTTMSKEITVMPRDSQSGPFSCAETLDLSSSLAGGRSAACSLAGMGTLTSRTAPSSRPSTSSSSA